MRACARLVAEADGTGRTRFAVLRSDPPLLLRRTGPRSTRLGHAEPGHTGPAEVHLVGGAAGPLAGDLLRLEIEVGPGASVCLRTVAASIVLPGTPDDAPSHVEVDVHVASGGRLEWLPEPLVAASGCRHVAAVRVELAEGANLVWRDELVCGRFGEQPGDVRISTTVTYGGRPLYRNDLAVGPRASGWSGPAVLDGAGAAGSLLVVDPAWSAGAPEPVVPGEGAAVMPLAGPAVLVGAVAADALDLRRRLDEGRVAVHAAARSGPAGARSEAAMDRVAGTFRRHAEGA